MRIGNREATKRGKKMNVLTGTVPRCQILYQLHLDDDMNREKNQNDLDLDFNDAAEILEPKRVSCSTQ